MTLILYLLAVCTWVIYWLLFFPIGG